MTNTLYEPYAVYKHGLHQKPILYFVRYVNYLIVLLVAGIVSCALCCLCKFNIIINVFAKIIICTLAPNIVFAIVFWRTEEFQYLLDFVKRFLKKILG